MAEVSQMFLIGKLLEDYTSANPGKPTYPLAQGDGGHLGGIGLPKLTEALLRYLPRTNATVYGQAGGRRSVRRLALERWWRFGEGSGLDPDRVVFANGGRGALQTWYKILQHFEGHGNDVIVSAAPWVSYPQAVYLNHLNLLCAPGDAANAFRMTPESLKETVNYSLMHHHRPAGLILTTPDNPTGSFTTLHELTLLIETAVELGVRHVFLDLIYQAVTTYGRYDMPKLWEALTPEARACVTFMDGLTKCAGASNARSAHLVLGNPEAARLALAAATHIDVANDYGMALANEVYGFGEKTGEDPANHPWIRAVVEPTNASRKIAVLALEDADIPAIADQGYYAFVDVSEWLSESKDVRSLSANLAREHGVAVVPGTAFRQPNFVRLSIANPPEVTRAALERFISALRAPS